MAEPPKTGYDAWLSKNRDRWNQVRKHVVYLDFRSELSAFDKYSYHQSFDRWKPDATQKRYKAVLMSVPSTHPGATGFSQVFGGRTEGITHTASTESSAVRLCRYPTMDVGKVLYCAITFSWEFRS